MSRAGRVAGPAAKKRELQERLRAAAAQHEASKAPAEPAVPEIPPEVALQWRAHRVFTTCKQTIVRAHPPLWPPEIAGAMLAENWLRAVYQRMQEAAITAATPEAESRERAAALGLVIPT